MEGAHRIVPIMSGNITLRELLIRENQFNEEGGKAIANGLASNRSIITLDIGWNTIGAESAVILAKALEENSTLLKLGLSIYCNRIIGRCNIGAIGAKALATSLTVNQTLLDLDLCMMLLINNKGFNDIKDEGLKELTEALKTNKTLKSLSLMRNGLKDEGWKMISECLEENNVLEYLNISNICLICIGSNEFSDNTLNEIKERQLTMACKISFD